MNLLAETKELGTLEITEVYEYYDRPLLFTCVNELEQHYLSLLVDDDGEEELWLLAPMSPNRYRQVRSGGVDLRDAYAAVEGGWLVRLVLSSASGEVLRVEQIAAEAMSDDVLPNAGERLALDTPTLPSHEHMHLQKTAKQLRRVAIDIALDVTGQLRSEVPARLLGNVLGAFQEAVDAFGQAVSSAVTARGRIPSAITASTQFVVVGTHHSVFTVELVSSQAANLFLESAAADALDELFRVLNTSEEAGGLIPVLSELGPRAVSKYRDFLDTLISGGAALALEWRFPDASRGGRAHLTSQRAERVVAVIDTANVRTEEDIRVHGVLVGANIRTRGFEIYVQRDKMKYEGKVAEEAIEQVDGAVLGRTYWATIGATTSIKAVTHDSTTDYVLKALTTV